MMSTRHLPPTHTHSPVFHCLTCTHEQPAAQTCSDGTPGIQSTSFDVCCSLECGFCGGPQCGLQNTTNGPFDCCVTEINDSGVFCSERGEAPCILEASEFLVVFCVSLNFVNFAVSVRERWKRRIYTNLFECTKRHRRELENCYTTKTCRVSTENSPAIQRRVEEYGESRVGEIRNSCCPSLLQHNGTEEPELRKRMVHVITWRE